MLKENYPRVTEIINKTKTKTDEKTLQNWYNSLVDELGELGAKKKQEEILNQGTLFHSNVEAYLRKQEISEKHDNFDGLIPFLKELSQEEIMMIEERIFSHAHQFTGKPDLVVKMRGKVTILDWTTSGKMKKRKWLQHKFLQAAAYSIALSEPDYNISVDKFVVIVATQGTYQYFEETGSTLEKLRKRFLTRLKKYNDLMYCAA